MHIKLKTILKTILIGWIFFSAIGLYAQKKDQQRDTLDFYKKLKKKASRHKATVWLYDAIIVDPVHRDYVSKPLAKEQVKQDPNARYEGKIVRKITIIVYDPFGYSVNDTFIRTINTLQKAGNGIHITTRNRYIRNILLFSVGDTIENIRIRESERLLRDMRYINDARITISGSKQADSADVEIKVLDKWSKVLSGDIGPTGGNLRIGDRNFAGLGQTLDQRAIYSTVDGVAYTGNYHFNNLKNTFISSDIYFNASLSETKTGLSFNRPFFSPLARWAGGAEGNRTWGQYRYSDSTSPPEKTIPLQYYNYDFWMAKSFALIKYGKPDRTRNIVGGLRYGSIRYLERPDFSIDTNLIHTNTTHLLGSVGYSQRKYYKDQFIYRFGANEDVPEGMLIQVTHGFIQKEVTGLRRYLGFEYSNGKHFKRYGYLSGSFKFGTLYASGLRNQSTLNTGLFYFTDLMQKDRWFFRAFTTLKLIQLVNKTNAESVGLKAEELYGFNSAGMAGNGKLLFNLEGVAYASYNFIGFRFAPVVMAGWGIVQTDNTQYTQSMVYQAYSLGLLIRNENLLNSSFEFSLGFYPRLPDERRDVFKLNPIGSFSLKVRSFEVLRPGTIGTD